MARKKPEAFERPKFKIGCPTKYKPEYVEQLSEYLSEPSYEIVAGRPVATDYKSITGFACKIGVSRSTLYAWADKHEEFKAVLDLATQYQEQFLSVNGLKGIINTQFAQFLAKNHIGMRDKAEGEAADTQVTVNNFGEWDETKEARLKELMEKAKK